MIKCECGNQDINTMTLLEWCLKHSCFFIECHVCGRKWEADNETIDDVNKTLFDFITDERLGGP